MGEMDENEVRALGLRKASDQENIKSDGFVKIYANNVGISASNWEMSLTFGEIIGTNDEGHPVVEQKVKVNMTREFVKAVSNLLATNIKAYEEKYGEVSFDSMLAIADQMTASAKAKKASVSKKGVAKKPALSLRLQRWSKPILMKCRRFFLNLADKAHFAV